MTPQTRRHGENRSSGPALCGALLVITAGCAHSTPASVQAALTIDQVSHLFSPKVSDVDGWARDLVMALQINQLPVDVTHACSVIAVAEQESNVQANPVVPGLPAIARASLAQRAKVLGPLGPLVLEKLLDGQAPGTSKTFEQRIDGLRTEADLDLLFRDILADHQRRSPVLYGLANAGATLFTSGSFEEHNPITTAGSMQVSVRFAQQHAATLHRDVGLVRDDLYTRAGGLLYGSARLWSFNASYDSMKYRFADYNAGAFTSRNAAFQDQVATLTNRSLALDGDLLSYDAADEVKSVDTQSMQALAALREALASDSLSKASLERDVRHEKREDFEQTDTWAVVKALFVAKYGREPVYARLPEVQLKSPKIKRSLSTAWFAQTVERRFDACLHRAQ